MATVDNTEPNLSGKLILITGAASGIGRATALELARRHAELILIDKADRVELAANECRRYTESPITWNTLDVSDPKACELGLLQAFDHACISAGAQRKVSHVFNCAGINPTRYELSETSDEYFDKLFAVNVKGIYNVTKVLVPHMLAPGGSFVNAGSICGLHPQANMAIYCATKYAVTGFSKSMALELGPKGIRVNVIAPGFIDTPTNSSRVAGDDAIKATSERVAMNRMGTPEEIADVVVFLMSDGARYMNGSVVEVNGGTG